MRWQREAVAGVWKCAHQVREGEFLHVRWQDQIDRTDARPGTFGCEVAEVRAVVTINGTTTFYLPGLRFRDRQRIITVEYRYPVKVDLRPGEVAL